MRLNDLLALSNVPRWSIISMLKSQTVADHTFRVLAIALEIATRVGVTLTTTDMIQILCHDGHEAWTADVPNPVKIDIEATGFVFTRSVPWLKAIPPFSSPDAEFVFKLADRIEALTYIDKYGTGAQAGRVVAGCESNLRAMVASPPEGVRATAWQAVVFAVVRAIREEEGRGFHYERG